jgi:putative heme-binding domain-containing protein
MGIPVRYSRFVFCAVLAMADGTATLSAAAQVAPQEDYNQWKEALGTNAATAPTYLTPLPGFAVDLVRSAQPSEGSWVAMTFDPRGRVVIAREDRGLLRLTLAVSTNAPARLETINTNLLECRGLLFAYDALYVNANNSKGLYRLRDTNSDGQFDEVILLQETPGGVGHGRNQLALGPDGMIYSIHGDDVMLPPEGVAPQSPFVHYDEDRLLPCAWDQYVFSAYVKMPCGHLIRTDRDGRSWELVAGGFRNPFGLAFNAHGDLFTFDADMEWDVGLPWYHPTRVLHIVPGGDYGWRRGTGVLPVWSPDTLPSVVDIGLSSPTAIKFGTKSHFPAPYRDALFILDWSYGRILAVQLTPTNATYRGRFEVFLKGRPLNVTGLDFGPDGALYFVTGGRRTQSGLYRVRALRPEPVNPAVSSARGFAQLTRRRLDELRGNREPQTLDFVWNALSGDRWTQYAARTTLESLPVDMWKERALADINDITKLRSSRGNEAQILKSTAANPELKIDQSLLTSAPTVQGNAARDQLAAQCVALLALARVGGSALQPRLRERLLGFLAQPLTSEERLVVLRALAVSFIRRGRPEPIEAARAMAALEAVYPANDAPVNQQLCELLVYLEAPDVVRKTMPLLASAATQEEKIQYLFLLRLVKNGWTIDERRAYFDALNRGRQEFQGANMLMTYLNYIRADAEAMLTQPERVALAAVLIPFEQPLAAPAAPAPTRKFVREWTMNDFGDSLNGPGPKRDLARGKRLFDEAGCAQCHRFGSQGGMVGPDLTAVGSRFDRRALLESILEPSKVIAEAYRTVSITLKSGAIIDGRVVADEGGTLSIAINPVDPGQQRRVKQTDIQTRRVSDLSAMPAGLVNTLTKQEVLELLAFLEMGETVQTPGSKDNR